MKAARRPRAARQRWLGAATVMQQPWRRGVTSPRAKRPPQPREAASPTVLDPPMATKDRPRPILAKGSRQLQTARSSRAATGGDAASNSDNGDGAASETRTASETPGSAIVTDVSCLAQLRGWLRGDGSGGNLDLLYSSSRDQARAQGSE